MELVYFLLPAMVGGLGLALLAGPLGSFMVWRRMAYFGDTLAHAALLGVALGGIWRVQQSTSLVVLVCMGTALTLVFLQKRPYLGNDTLLGILAHTVLSLGLVLYAFSPNPQQSLSAILMGDLLVLGWQDVFWIYLISLPILMLLLAFWRQLMNMVIDEDLAHIEGVKVGALNMMMMLVIAVFVAISMQLVGVLLITALLIISPATARYWSNTPEQMAFYGSLFAMISVVLGVYLAALLDTPLGPTIVILMAVKFLLTIGVRYFL